MESGMTISETLKRVVAKATKTQSLRSVGRESGVDPAVLSRWLAGDKIPRADTLDAIAIWAGFVLKKK
jgi:transcriptional regulator with XRE-family HTH domain